ncbi:MAG: hypothetical protein QXW39_10195 [Candidatus Bathyarchaeia archaeon]
MSNYIDVSEITEKFKDGITWRSAIAIVYSAIFLFPVTLYMSLVSGVGISSVYITIILFSELAALFRTRLSKQEVYMMFMFVGWASSSTFILDTVVWRNYLMTNPLSFSFRDPGSGLPIPLAIPWWWAPPYGSNAYLQRTVLQWSWLVPLGIAMTFNLLIFAADLSLTMLFAKIYIEEEKLPFPLQRPTAEICITLAERSEDRVRIFTLFAFLGFLWGTIAYGLPNFSRYIIGSTAASFNPFVDLSQNLERLGLQASILMFTIEPLSYLSGLLIPLNISASLMIGDLLIAVVGNHLALTYFCSFFPQWKLDWFPGMPSALIAQKSVVDVWFGFFVGLTIGLSVVSLYNSRRAFVRTANLLFKFRGAELEGYLDLRWIVAIYLCSTLGGLALFYVLVPSAPFTLIILAALINVIGGFLLTAVSTRSVAETGYGISIPYLWYGILLFSGYRYLDAWLISPPMPGAMTPSFVASLKVAYLTETKPSSYFKGLLILIPSTWLAGIFWVSVFWSLAPIPSSAYPNTTLSWPTALVSNLIWLSRSFGQISFILFGPGIIIPIILGILLSKFPLPISLIGLVSGMASYSGGPAVTAIFIANFLGSLFAEKVIIRRMGKDWFYNYRASLVAGFAAGEGTAVAIFAAAVVTAKAMWVLPF